MPAARDVTAEPFEAVLFDMDGTLLDSLTAVIRCWTQWAGEFGVSLEALQAAPTHGRTARDIVADHVAPDVVDRAYARIVELEVSDTEGCVPLPGALAALAGSRPRHAIVTSSSAPLATARLAAAGIEPPAVLVTADDVRRGKPDPEPFVLAARRLGADPARCLVVEDAPAGLAAGTAAGSATLAVTTTHTPGQLVADLVVATLDEVRLTTADGAVRVAAAPGQWRKSPV